MGGYEPTPDTGLQPNRSNDEVRRKEVSASACTCVLANEVRVFYALGADYRSRYFLPRDFHSAALPDAALFTLGPHIDVGRRCGSSGREAGPWFGRARRWIAGWLWGMAAAVSAYHPEVRITPLQTGEQVASCRSTMTSSLRCAKLNNSRYRKENARSTQHGIGVSSKFDVCHFGHATERVFGTLMA